MRVLVTGGAGFIGSHVTEALLTRGHTVGVLDNLTSGFRANLPARCELSVMDITDAGATAAEVARFAPDVIVHLAAQTDVAESIADPARDAAVNVLGTLSILVAAAQTGCRKLVFASSSTVYGEPLRQPVREDDPLRPISPYGVSKAAGEHYVRVLCEQNHIAYTILRLGNVCGPRDSTHTNHVVTSFTHALLSGRAPAVEWDGEQTKDYVYVGDVAAAVIAALDGGDNDVFNVGSERGTSVNTILEMVGAAVGRRVVAERRPPRPGDVRTFVMSCARAHRRLGWRPVTPLAEAVAATVTSMTNALRREEAREPSSAV